MQYFIHAKKNSKSGSYACLKKQKTTKQANKAHNSLVSDAQGLQPEYRHTPPQLKNMYYLNVINNKTKEKTRNKKLTGIWLTEDGRLTHKKMHSSKIS